MTEKRQLCNDCKVTITLGVWEYDSNKYCEICYLMQIEKDIHIPTKERLPISVCEMKSDMLNIKDKQISETINRINTMKAELERLQDEYKTITNLSTSEIIETYNKIQNV
jgi:hypothetical protein